eukprot:GHUV01010966.1.p1 GENE.GHUV01010966.1~~GHUV01010966.1.p1  ORF type:complete len:282 (+),score=86.47 GHUV01010966.1:441-1286(+)
MSAVSSRVLILKGDPITADGPPAYKLLSLPNPSTGQQQQYILTDSGLLEVNRVKHQHTCWLVDNTFISDGSAYLATPINAVYVLLALLQQQGNQQASSMYQEAESLLCCESWPSAHQLLPLAQQHLSCICDVKEVGDDLYYRLNDQKVIAFLRVCTHRALAAFQSHSPASIAGLSTEDQQMYVLRFLKEYVPAMWHDKLVESYGIDLKAFNSGDSAGTVRPALATVNQPLADTAEKRPKLDPKEAARKKAEETRAAAAAAKLKKDAAGTKKISSFFSAKKT